ncbi:hypothetical protein [Streptomyces anthocyanicus]|uniref:hypothetical protein n=1 Tax=Streptomyces anthocyanicus TaxID=68174 RepID=UPI0033E118EC
MARRLVSDDQKMFRVVIVARQRRDNPNWERGNLASPRFLWDGPEYTTAYGPYNTPGAARGQLTFHTVDVYGKPREGVVSGHIEQAHTVWAPADQAEEPEQYKPDPDGRPTYAHTDVDGDRLLVAPAVYLAHGQENPGIYFRTSLNGSSIPVTALPAFVARLSTIADTARTEAEEQK